MDCNTPVSWEGLLRRVVRVSGSPGDLCFAIALDRNQLADGAYECVSPSLLTKYALAVDDNNRVRVQPSDGGLFNHLSCDEIERSTEDLFSSTILFQNQFNSVIYTWQLEFDAVECRTDCSQSELTTLDLVRGTVIDQGGQKYVRVVVADGSFTPSDCDIETIGFEAIVRTCIVSLGSGEYAWRYVDES